MPCSCKLQTFVLCQLENCWTARVFFLRLKTNQKCCSNIGKGNCGCVKKNCRYAQVLFVFLLISHVLTR